MNNFLEFKKEILNKIESTEKAQSYYLNRFVSVLEYEFNVELQFVIPEKISISQVLIELSEFIKFYLSETKNETFKNILIKYLVG